MNKEKRDKLMLLYIGEPFPIPPYPYPPLECIFLDESGIIFKKWEEERNKSLKIYKKQVEEWKKTDAENTKLFKKLIKEYGDE